MRWCLWLSFCSNTFLWKKFKKIKGRYQMRIPRVAIGALLVMLLAGCQAMTGETAGQNIDDSTITASVKTQLTKDKASNFTKIDVDTVRGVVSLNGVVDSAQTKTRAEQVARSVGGVRNVINNLQIQKSTS
jgi:hyperosmotically inducible periplasmic protein